MLWHIVLYLILNYLPMWYTIYAHRHLRPDKVRDQDLKFAPFICYDYESWSYFWTIFTHAFFWPRFIGVWSLNFICCISAWIIMIGAGPFETVSEQRLAFFQMSNNFWSRQMLHLYGIFLWTVNVEANSVGQEEILNEYRKFLGPDWAGSKIKAGVHVSNH